MFFKQTNTIRYVKLILTKFFSELTDEERLGQSTFLEELDILRREFVNISRQELHHAPRNMLRSCGGSSEAGGR